MQLHHSYSQNGRFTNQDSDFSRRVEKKVAELWKTDSKVVNMLTPFTTGELVEALKSMKEGKAPGSDDIHPEFLLHARDAATKWLCQYMSTCLERCKTPQLWRKATVIVLPKPNKHNDRKRFRSSWLLCIPFKLLERMVHGRTNPIFDPQLPHEQAGFRKGQSIVNQITLLTQDIEDFFEAKETAGAVLVDLTAAYKYNTM